MATIISCNKCGEMTKAENSVYINYSSVCLGCAPKMYVVYNEEVSIWCYEEEAYNKMAAGWKLYGCTYHVEEADKLAEEACHVR